MFVSLQASVQNVAGYLCCLWKPNLFIITNKNFWCGSIPQVPKWSDIPPLFHAFMQGKARQVYLYSTFHTQW